MMNLEIMAVINFINGKIKELEDAKKQEGNPEDIWDETSIACNLKIETYKEILDYVKQLKNTSITAP